MPRPPQDILLLPTQPLLAPAGSVEAQALGSGYPGRSPDTAPLSSSASPLPQQDVKELEPKEYLLLWRNFARLRNATAFLLVVSTVWLPPVLMKPVQVMNEAWKGVKAQTQTRNTSVGTFPLSQRDPEKGTSFRKRNSSFHSDASSARQCSWERDGQKLQAEPSWRWRHPCVFVLCSGHRPPGRRGCPSR